VTVALCTFVDTLVVVTLIPGTTAPLVRWKELASAGLPILVLKAPVRKFVSRRLSLESTSEIRIDKHNPAYR
jgi:hypothetical protein